jgi:hypothetical protein
MTNKQSYIVHPTIKKNIKINSFSRERLVNEERVNNMGNDDRYIIRTYDSTENLTKFYKTRYTDFFLIANYMKSIDDLI